METLITDYQAKYLAYELTKRCPSDSVEKLASAANESPLGRYELPRRSGEAHLYQLGHPLAGHVISEAQSRDLPIAEVEFRCADHDGKLNTFTAVRQKEIQREVSERNALFYEAEAAKLNGWADDLKVGLEREIKEFDRQIKETRRASVTALTLEEKPGSQKLIKAIESQRNEKRRSLFEAQDQVDSKRTRLIEEIEGKLINAPLERILFTIRWSFS